MKSLLKIKWNRFPMFSFNWFMSNDVCYKCFFIHLLMDVAIIVWHSLALPDSIPIWSTAEYNDSSVLLRFPNQFNKLLVTNIHFSSRIRLHFSVEIFRLKHLHSQIKLLSALAIIYIALDHYFMFKLCLFLIEIVRWFSSSVYSAVFSPFLYLSSPRDWFDMNNITQQIIPWFILCLM